MIPSVHATNSKFSGAPISIPLWKVEAPFVGATLFPKYELILDIPGAGHKGLPFSTNSMNSTFVFLENRGK